MVIVYPKTYAGLTGTVIGMEPLDDSVITSRWLVQLKFSDILLSLTRNEFMSAGS